jgi:hypothetical protein
MDKAELERLLAETPAARKVREAFLLAHVQPLRQFLDKERHAREAAAGLADHALKASQKLEAQTAALGALLERARHAFDASKAARSTLQGNALRPEDVAERLKADAARWEKESDQLKASLTTQDGWRRAGEASPTGQQHEEFLAMRVRIAKAKALEKMLRGGAAGFR